MIGSVTASRESATIAHASAVLPPSRRPAVVLLTWLAACGGDDTPGGLIDAGDEDLVDGGDGDDDDAGTPLPAWAQQAYVEASNTALDDRFGKAVALSADGTTLAIGAYSQNGSGVGIDPDDTSTGAGHSGAVYVFTRTGTAWAQSAYLKASNAAADDTFGHAVALSADGATLAVGALGEAGAIAGVDGNQASNGAAAAGAVYVFARAGGTWSQQAYVKASNPGADDWFGWSVALAGDGSTLAVGPSTRTAPPRASTGMAPATRRPRPAPSTCSRAPA